MAACELREPRDVLLESDFAYVFETSGAEQGSVLALLNRARKLIGEKHKPDGYNICINIGAAAGQSRMPT